MLSKLVRKVDVVPPSLKCLKFRRFLGMRSVVDQYDTTMPLRILIH